jgi:hypothetical protein
VGQGHYFWATVDVLFIVFDECGAGEAEAAYRVSANLAERSTKELHMGHSVLQDTENLAKKVCKNGCFLGDTEVLVPDEAADAVLMNADAQLEDDSLAYRRELYLLAGALVIILGYIGKRG